MDIYIYTWIQWDRCHKWRLLLPVPPHTSLDIQTYKTDHNSSFYQIVPINIRRNVQLLPFHNNDPITPIYPKKFKFRTSSSTFSDKYISMNILLSKRDIVSLPKQNSIATLLGYIQSSITNFIE